MLVKPVQDVGALMKQYSRIWIASWLVGAFLIGAVFSCPLYVGVGMSYDYVRGYFKRTEFVSKIWVNEADVQRGVRLLMVDNLIRTKRFDQMRRDQVIALLGPPTKTGKFRDAELVYWLGPERGLFSIDSEWLLIYMANGKVSRVSTVTD
jgi:hypothetical protein